MKGLLVNCFKLLKFTDTENVSNYFNAKLVHQNIKI